MRTNKLPTNGNKNKPTWLQNRFEEKVKQDLDLFFKQIKQFAQPQSTRFVRKETGAGLRDGKEDRQELPSSWSKRGCYQRFCHERSWIVETSARGTTKLKRIEGVEQKQACHWRTFLKYWKKITLNLFYLGHQQIFVENATNITTDLNVLPPSKLMIVGKTIPMRT